MTTQQVFDILIGIVAREVHGDEGEYTEDTQIYDITVDTIEHLSIISECDKQFGIATPNFNLNDTLWSVSERISKIINEKA